MTRSVSRKCGAVTAQPSSAGPPTAPSGILEDLDMRRTWTRSCFNITMTPEQACLDGGETRKSPIQLDPMLPFQPLPQASCGLLASAPSAFSTPRPPLHVHGTSPFAVIHWHTSHPRVLFHRPLLPCDTVNSTQAPIRRLMDAPVLQRMLTRFCVLMPSCVSFSELRNL